MFKFYKKGLIGLALLIIGLNLFINLADAKQARQRIFKMVFLPDIHFSTENKKDDWVLYNESFVIFQDVITDLNKIKDLDFIVLGGDLLENKNKNLESMPLFLDSLQMLKPPYNVILGDRDVDLEKKMSKYDFTREFKRHGLKDKTYWQTEPVKDFLLVGLDTSVANSKYGEINFQQLLWLNNVLDDNKDKFIIILMHHPAIKIHYKTKFHPDKSFILANAIQFRALIANYPQVKMVVSGHHHANYAEKRGNILYMNMPSIVTYPNEYKILTINSKSNSIGVETRKIKFRQFVKKAKNDLINSEYASKYNPRNPKKILDFQRGGKLSNKKRYYLYK